jgi:hypothetical protein
MYIVHIIDMYTVSKPTVRTIHFEDNFQEAYVKPAKI